LIYKVQFLEKIKFSGNLVSDSVLWSQLRLGDEESFSLLFGRYYSSLINYGRTLNSQDETVKDCVQDVFVDVWKNAKRLSDVVFVKAYLFSCVRNRISKIYERDHIFSSLNDVDSFDFNFDFSIEDRLISNETMEAKIENLNKHINNLPSRQKEALYLRFHQDLSIEQVAEVMNLNYQSAKNLLHRAIIRLRIEFTVPFLALVFN